MGIENQNDQQPWTEYIIQQNTKLSAETQRLKQLSLPKQVIIVPDNLNEEQKKKYISITKTLSDEGIRIKQDEDEGDYTQDEIIEFINMKIKNNNIIINPIRKRWKQKYNVI
jgi:hypothetical protein